MMSVFVQMYYHIAVKEMVLIIHFADDIRVSILTHFKYLVCFETTWYALLII